MNMIRSWIIAIAFVMMSVCAVNAQDISGDWQGTLKGGQGPDLRLVLRVTKNDGAGWKGTLYSIDQPPVGLDGFALNLIALQGTDFKFSVESPRISFEGKLAASGNSIEGTWKGVRTLPLEWRRATRETQWTFELPKHSVSFVSVDKDVKLEVLDFGGTGRPMIFLAGLGSTAHVFDQFAPKFSATHHVYGITRRGFGASSAPVPASGNYSADRLGDDILAVMVTLKLDRPVLVGHSIAGQEMSSIGSRHPENISGLVYLDAGYAYAYYDSSQGNFLIDAIELRKKLEQLMFGGGQKTPLELVQELLQNDLPRVEKGLRKEQERIRVRPAPPKGQENPVRASAVDKAVLEGQQKYTDIRIPILAFFAVPHKPDNVFEDDSAARARLEAWELARMETLAKAFESGLPSARVVRLPNADHFVIQTHEADVLREMRAFLNTLR